MCGDEALQRRRDAAEALIVACEGESCATMRANLKRAFPVEQRMGPELAALVGQLDRIGTP